jgi:hypothetical protein
MSIEESQWTHLFKAGSIAALLAGLLFRRNIGAEVTLFTGVGAIPQSIGGWYDLLQANPFVGLSFLAVFDLVNYALVGLVFLALGAAVWPRYKNAVAVALASGLIGIAVLFASNISLSMFSLSQQYAAANSEAQKNALLSAGQALLAAHNPLAVFPGTGMYVSFLLIALAGLLFAAVVLRSQGFSRLTAYAGLLAGGCDLAYCLTLPFAPDLRTLFVASGGLFWMIWHLLVARGLWQISRRTIQAVPYPVQS